MSNLSLKEFYELTEKEKRERYKDLNDHDRFLVRISMDPGVKVIGYEEVTEEEKERANKLIKKIKEMKNNKN